MKPSHLFHGFLDVIPIGARAAAWVEKYLMEGRPQLLTVEHDALFVSDYGEAVSGEFVAAKIRRYKAFAGIDKAGAVHLLRHACATHMLEGGADTRLIQAMLGHANLATTQIYTHVSIDKLKEIHAATHPARLERRQDGERGDDGLIGRVASSAASSALLAMLDADESDDEDSP
ncbi:MAG: tyrosine-type recombinase/integrase [Pseudomonadota bacterium]